MTGGYHARGCPLRAATHTARNVFSSCISNGAACRRRGVVERHRHLGGIPAIMDDDRRTSSPAQRERYSRPGRRSCHSHRCGPRTAVHRPALARQLRRRRHRLRGLSLVAGRLPLWQRLYVPNGCAGMTPSVTSAEALVGGGRPSDQHSKSPFGRFRRCVFCDGDAEFLAKTGFVNYIF